jgi:hypothetical protein
MVFVPKGHYASGSGLEKSDFLPINHPHKKKRLLQAILGPSTRRVSFHFLFNCKSTIVPLSGADVTYSKKVLQFFKLF